MGKVTAAGPPPHVHGVYTVRYRDSGEGGTASKDPTSTVMCRDVGSLLPGSMLVLSGSLKVSETAPPFYMVM